MSGPPWLLVLDVGSSSARGWFYDPAGRPLAPGRPARARYGWEVADGRMERSAEDLLARVAEVIDAALARAREERLEIAGVAVASFWHSLVGVDRSGAAATPLTGWGDERAADTARSLAAEHDAEAYHTRTGCFLHASYPLVRLRWLRDRGPVRAEGVRWWGSFAEYLESRLFGSPRVSHSIASGSGLLDVRRLDWDPQALALAGIEAGDLPPLAEAAEPRTGLTGSFAKRWPELAAVPWFPALGDGACANLGSGATGPDRLGVTVGTTAAVRLLLGPDAAVEVPPDLWAYRLDRRRWVVGGAVSNGGAVLGFLRRTLALPGENSWDRILASTPAAAHGLTVIPGLVAERPPTFSHGQGAALLGARLDTRPEEIARAFLEAVTYRVAEVCERLDRWRGRAGVVVGSGGALHDFHEWAQLLADVLDRPVALTPEPEETSRGAALVAWEALGTPMPDPADTALLEAVAPDPERAALHARARRRQEQIAAVLERARPPDPGGGSAQH